MASSSQTRPVTLSSGASAVTLSSGAMFFSGKTFHVAVS